MRQNLLLLFFVLTLASAHADNILLRGHITSLDGNVPPTVSLWSSDESSEINAPVLNGAFSFNVPITTPGLYNLRFLNTSYELMLSPADKAPSVSITIENGRLKDITVDDAKENEAYKTLIAQIKIYDEKLRKHFLDCDKEENCGKDLNFLLTNYRDELSDIRDKYKGTYTAETLCKMKIPVVAKDVKNSASEFRAGYFENVPFGDKAILKNPVYKEMIDAYTDFLIEPKISKEDAFIKDLMKKASANPVVLSQTAGTLYESLFKRSREKMLGIFIAWYNENKVAVNNASLELKIKGLSSTMPGGRYLDIVRDDVTGRQTSLKKVVDASSCTLLLFWSSDCSHCREEMPQIKAAYEKYHVKGLNIFAVSLEQNKTKWADYIKENGLVWTNVTNLVGTDNPAIQYMVTATPTLILIDKNGTIAHRFTPKNKLEKYIEEVLNK
ncbi:MAG: thiol:disulfide interchange protein [Bacteroidetes bacterium]|nr:thiol:disulfide interchange protein [Bacteroidota bacterium]